MTQRGGGLDPSKLKRACARGGQSWCVPVDVGGWAAEKEWVNGAWTGAKWNMGLAVVVSSLRALLWALCGTRHSPARSGAAPLP